MQYAGVDPEGVNQNALCTVKFLECIRLSERSYLNSISFVFPNTSYCVLVYCGCTNLWLLSIYIWYPTFFTIFLLPDPLWCSSWDRHARSSLSARATLHFYNWPKRKMEFGMTNEVMEGFSFVISTTGPIAYERYSVTLVTVSIIRTWRNLIIFLSS